MKGFSALLQFCRTKGESSKPSENLHWHKFPYILSFSRRLARQLHFLYRIPPHIEFLGFSFSILSIEGRVLNNREPLFHLRTPVRRRCKSVMNSYENCPPAAHPSPTKRSSYRR